MIQVGYVGSESYHVLTAMDKNMAVPQTCSDPAGCISGGIRAANQTARVPKGTLYLPSVPPVGVGPAALQGRPNPFVGPTLSWFFDGTSSYHAGTLSLTKRSSRGLNFKVNYSYGKVLDINSASLVAAAVNEPATVANPYDLKSAKGPARTGDDPLSRLLDQLLVDNKADGQILEALSLAALAGYPSDAERVVS